MNKGLVWGGGAVAAAGAVGALVAKEQVESQARVDEFTASFQGLLIDVTPDYTGMWVAIVIAALGVVALIVGLAARPAVSSSSPPAS